MTKNILFRSLPLLTALAFVACSSDDNSLLLPVDPSNPNTDKNKVIPDSKPSAVQPAKGFYIVNEDWFGHDLGTVNYFKNDGSILYRAYRAANPNETLGLTAVFATIYGDNAYFVSKQENRLVVADAATLTKKASLTDIGGDGRSFIGVSPEKGYIATSNGVFIFNTKTLQVTGQVAGVVAETASMLQVGPYVLALTNGQGIVVIDTLTDTISHWIEGTNFSYMVRSKDGTVWIGAANSLFQVDPVALKITDEFDITAAPINATWYAWNAGSFSASTQQNVLYWTAGNSVAQFDVETKSLRTDFYNLGQDESGVPLEFYGAGLRVDPLTDQLVLTVKREGWGDNFSYNWVQIINPQGGLVSTKSVTGGTGNGDESDLYYWFPAMPFFEDANAPEILLNQVILKPGERKAIALHDKIVDADHTFASILKSLDATESKWATYELKQDSLIVTAKNTLGKDQMTLQAQSNGRLVKKDIRIDIRE